MALPDGNLLSALPARIEAEVFQELLRAPGLRIERILSRGQTSPAEGWYDQAEHEWIAVLQGAALLRFDDGSEIRLDPGDHLHIPAHRKHRVAWTDPDRITVWLAVFHG